MAQQQDLKQHAGEVAFSGYLVQIWKLMVACGIGTADEKAVLHYIASQLIDRGIRGALAAGIPEQEVRQVVLLSFPEAGDIDDCPTPSTVN